MRVITGALLALVAAGAGAQSVEQLPAWDMNMDRVHTTSPGKCRAATYIVPTTYLYLSARTKLTSFNGHVSSGATVYVGGWDKAMLQQIARAMQDDLVAKLRATGATVLTYDEVRADLALTGRWSVDSDVQLPVHSDRFHPGFKFVVAAPSDEQAFAASGAFGPLLGSGTPFGNLARARNATVLVPSVLISVPNLEAQKDGSLYRSEASIKYAPHVTLNGLAVTGTTGTGGACFFAADPMGWRPASTAAGHLTPGRENSFRMEGVAQARGDYLFTLDPAEFRAGTLRIDQAVNNWVVASITRR